MIFCVEMLHDFFPFAKRLHDFSHSQGCMIFFVC